MKKLLTVLGFIIGCELVGGIGAFFTTPAIPTWYATLIKPVFSPPNWLFGPVWTLLYALMGVAIYLIWSNKKKDKKKTRKVAMKYFGIQLALNFIWSPIFFGMQNLLLALFVIVVLWIYILKTIKSFAKVDKIASYLLYPYLAWVSFASVLNFSIWLLNK